MNFLRFLSGIRLPFLDGLFQFFTYFGQAVPLLLVLCALYWCLNKEVAARIGLAFFTSGLVLQNLKIFCRIDRPWVLDPDFHPVESAVPGATGYSFPSGHSQSAAAFWGYLACYYQKKKRAFFFVLAFLVVGFSRMYLGCHTPKDVLTGILIGLASVVFIRFAVRHIPNTRNANLMVSLFFILVCTFTAIHAFSLLSQGIISEANAKDCITAAGSGIGFAVGWYLERVYIRFSLPQTSKKRALRFLVGVLLLLLLKLLLSSFFADKLSLKMIEYGLLLLYITAGYPALFSRKRAKASL